ncbi:YybH family protein [Psychroserpens ponticola]|uniref:Nuclear transport factor 2 family protein n=1 Tax=Psychroserpens ponticola TaxID=2932268 RepID=A0ABY7RX76_9FLAO|nr:nuclear transport factor 2 family protein [Psychroserpens ponticola]WCO01281.1 nuclear transport factor 2 family protein [Psychroserpens ponticola]
MNTLKTTTLIMILFVTVTNGQTKKNSTSDYEAVLTVMKAYKDALQNLTIEGTFELFTEDSKVFESGGVEGTYAHYIEHHLGPELGHFKNFTFSDYEIDVQVDGIYAFTTETYVYTIVLKPNEEGESRTIAKKGVATSILKKIDEKWKIIKTHSSSRNKK